MFILENHSITNIFIALFIHSCCNQFQQKKIVFVQQFFCLSQDWERQENSNINKYSGVIQNYINNSCSKPQPLRITQQAIDPKRLIPTTRSTKNFFYADGNATLSYSGDCLKLVITNSIPKAFRWLLFVVQRLVAIIRMISGRLIARHPKARY